MNFESGRVHDGESRFMGRELVEVPDLDKHVACKQVVPGRFVDHADMELVVRVGPRATILNVEFLVLEVGEHPGIKGLKFFN